MLWIISLLVSLVVGAFLFLFRVGHLVESGTVRRILQRADRRGRFVLYLRGFDADVPWSGLPLFHWGIAGLFGVLSDVANHPAFAPAAGFERFIKSTSEYVLDKRPVVAVAASGEVLGIGRVRLDAYEWKSDVASLCADARSIIFLVGGSAGLMWELAHLVDARHLGKTIFVIPPWDIMKKQYGAAAETIILRARDIFKGHGIEMPKPNWPGRVFLVSEGKQLTFVEDLALLWSSDRALAAAISRT
jgi:hypothetical protein